MKVKDLIIKLQDMPQNAYIVVDNKVVNGVELENGRFKEGYMVDSWLPLDHGNKEAVRFTILAENSNGSIVDRKF